MQSATSRAHEFQTDDAALRPIAEKVIAGARLSGEDALALYRSGDILAVGWLAKGTRPDICLISSHAPRGMR